MKWRIALRAAAPMPIGFEDCQQDRKRKHRRGMQMEKGLSGIARFYSTKHLVQSTTSPAQKQPLAPATRMATAAITRMRRSSVRTRIADRKGFVVVPRRLKRNRLRFAPIVARRQRLTGIAVSVGPHSKPPQVRSLKKTPQCPCSFLTSARCRYAFALFQALQKNRLASFGRSWDRRAAERPC
jgi:hypothetical protein